MFLKVENRISTPRMLPPGCCEGSVRGPEYVMLCLRTVRFTPGHQDGGCLLVVRGHDSQAKILLLRAQRQECDSQGAPLALSGRSEGQYVALAARGENRPLRAPGCGTRRRLAVSRAHRFKNTNVTVSPHQAMGSAFASTLTIAQLVEHLTVVDNADIRVSLVRFRVVRPTISSVIAESFCAPRVAPKQVRL